MKGERIGIIGAGNMGEALIGGIVAQSSRLRQVADAPKLWRRNGFGGQAKLKAQLIASDKDKKRRDYIRKKYRISVTSDNLKVVASSTVIILAVKPQDIETILLEISYQSSLITHQLLFISIAAGVTTEYIESFFEEPMRVIRIMPNAPALIGEGVSAVCLGKYAKLRDYRKVESLFKMVGEVVRVEESLMDKVTAISGSGPAYFFLLIKHLTDIGIRLGLGRKITERLVNHTASGSAEMIIKTKQRPEVLIGRVASKGGTTEAALGVFAKEKWGKIIEQGIRAAVWRAKELRRD